MTGKTLKFNNTRVNKKKLNVSRHKKNSCI